MVARPWIDNLIIRVSHHHRAQAEACLLDILTRLNLEAKFEGEDGSFLNVDVDWYTDTFRLTQKWLDTASATITKALQKQTLSLRLTWKVIGLAGYYTYTTTRLLGLLRKTYAFQSAQAQGDGMNWDRGVQIPNAVRQELHQVVSSMQDQHAHFPIWHPPALPVVEDMGFWWQMPAGMATGSTICGMACAPRPAGPGPQPAAPPLLPLVDMTSLLMRWQASGRV